jgi:hypothetical protein
MSTNIETLVGCVTNVVCVLELGGTRDDGGDLFGSVRKNRTLYFFEKAAKH